MIENNASGKAIGYQAGRRIHLVRNPNWDKSTDYKPAYLDEIDMPQGNDDTTIASRRVVEGSDMLTGDFSPPPQVLATVVKNQKDQLELFPGGSARYVSMNTTVKPFDDINVRKAVVAGFNREAMRLVRGGELVGDIPTHMIPPGLPGFEEAGGLKGPGIDFMSHPAGDADARGVVLQEGRLRVRQVRGRRDAADGRHVRGRRREGGRGREGELRAARLQGPPAAGHAGRDVHAVLQLAAGATSRSARTSAGARTSPTRRRSSTRRSTARTSSSRATRTGPS